MQHMNLPHTLQKTVKEKGVLFSRLLLLRLIFLVMFSHFLPFKKLGLKNIFILLFKLISGSCDFLPSYFRVVTCTCLSPIHTF